MEHLDYQYFIPIINNLFRYFVIGGIAFLIFYKLFPKKFADNKIQSRFAKQKDFIHEILHSVQSSIVIGLIIALFLFTPLKNYSVIYQNFSEHSFLWIPLSLILALIVHDTYFYWMHRIVHHPKLYKNIHLIHHKSINPSPWTSLSFHFLEAITEALVVPLIIFVIPMHPIALIVYGMLAFFMNVYGHLGYEIAPKWFRHSFLFEIMNTSTYHNLHHSRFKGNYGLYFRVWDRLLNTENPNYVKAYDVIQKRRFGTHAPNSFTLKSNFLLVLIIVVSFMMISAKIPEGIEGKWLDDKGGGIIKIYEKDGLYFGQLIRAVNEEENKKILEYGEIILMKNFKKKSSKEYCCGTIFQPKEKRTIQTNIVLKDANTLKINGKYGVFSGSRIWKRL